MMIANLLRVNLTLGELVLLDKTSRDPLVERAGCVPEPLETATPAEIFNSAI